jgi:hypothetical protein
MTLKVSAAQRAVTRLLFDDPQAMEPHTLSRHYPTGFLAGELHMEIRAETLRH